MYLKSIEMQGFKSFANKMNLQFHEGITGIVGPNGSGKSNVADAVRWVLGEQSAKSLRGGNMQDVIFSGTETRKPLGYASVAITFDNTDHKLNIDFNEVTVTRRLYRSGEREYLLNGAACRLKDINELFYDTGIGKEGYSIIGQGQIDRILSGKPEERRELFDEAAGIVKFKRRKAATQKKLADEQQNLVRVTDILSELTRQLGPLERQSETARVYLKKKEELKLLDVNMFLMELERIREDLGKIDQRYEIASGELQETKEAFEQTKQEYDRLEKELETLNETLERLAGSKARWQQTSERLKEWKDQDVTPNQTIWDIDRFLKGTISEQEMERLQNSLKEMRQELEKERQENASRLKAVKKEEKEAREELKELKQGRKAYPRELEEARYELRNRLQEYCGKFVNVQILADLLDIKDERWHNAVEGYLGNNKLLLVVEPRYAREALEIYKEMDKRKYCRAAVLDTERVMENEHAVRPGALAEEVTAKTDYAAAYIRFFLGNVMKCESVEELRECRIGITPDCVLYHSYRLQHINPDLYTRRAYIGETSMRKRIRQLELKCEELQNERLPLQEAEVKIRRLLELEMLPQPTDDYMQWIKDADMISDKEKRKKHLQEQMEQLREESVAVLDAQKNELMERMEEKKASVDLVKREIWKNEKDIDGYQRAIIDQEEALAVKTKEVQAMSGKEVHDLETEFQEFRAAKKSVNYDYLRRQKVSEQQPLLEQAEREYQKLVDVRSAYLRTYPNRTFSASARDNTAYEKLLEELQCGDLERYRESAKEQAKSAVEHFKDDFIFKIRAAIRDAYQRKDELNRIISKLDFGKDKYQFVITKNKGADGKYYKMFMDDALQIDPMQLSHTMDNQLNMFTMEHEEEYGEMMNELINIFIPPENATREELDEAKKNMEKYADYRTYLSFDMHQIVSGKTSGEETDMHIGLSRMIRKNSGGEGQNPLYVALLASFAQIYRINQTSRIRRNPTLRLVVLDEAFSKMDAEKVASCISLIRGLGFQAIISATNDKIQNYLENVDKTFVYANPNKKHISIQEFERTEFGALEDE